MGLINIWNEPRLKYGNTIIFDPNVNFPNMHMTVADIMALDERKWDASKFNPILTNPRW